MADTDYIAHLTGHLREIVVDCYLSGLNHTYSKLFLLYIWLYYSLTDILKLSLSAVLLLPHFLACSFDTINYRSQVHAASFIC